ncbi:MAG: DUF2642 domain-containing protein [Bacillaceae bacterium]|nr:DUF2642 domain-containing protein [Bacillaceae bacterium]
MRRKVPQPYYRSSRVIYPVEYESGMQEDRRDSRGLTERKEVPEADFKPQRKERDPVKAGGIRNVQFVVHPFLRRLTHLIGSRVEVGTMNHVYAGILSDVYPDHILLKNQGMMHIRMEQVVFIKPLEVEGAGL